MRIPQNKQQPPFREATLLSSHSFRTFCDKNGIHLWQKDLKILWGKSLLIPSIKCYLSGFPKRRVYMEQNGKKDWFYVKPDDLDKVNYEKLDPQIYYEHGWVYFNEKKKGGPYKKGFKKGQHSFPSQEKNSALEPSLEEITREYLTSPDPFESNYVTFFDKTQIIAIKIILQRCGYHHNRLNTQRLENDDLIKHLQAEIQGQQKFLRVFQDWRDLMKNFSKACQKKYDEAYKLYPKDEKERALEYQGFYDFEVKKRRPLFEAVLAKHKISTEEMLQWRDFLANHSFFNEYSFHFPFLKKYLREIKNHTLTENEYVNEMIADLNWVFAILTGKEKTVAEVLQHLNGYKLCEICQVGFKPRNRRQITCGRQICQKQHKKRLKKTKGYYR